MRIPAHVLDQFVSACRDDGVTSDAVGYAVMVLTSIHDALCKDQPADGHVHFEQLSQWLRDRVDEEVQIHDAVKAAGL